jgi:hypothetical protein
MTNGARGDCAKAIAAIDEHFHTFCTVPCGVMSERIVDLEPDLRQQTSGYMQRTCARGIIVSSNDAIIEISAGGHLLVIVAGDGALVDGHRARLLDKELPKIPRHS